MWRKIHDEDDDVLREYENSSFFDEDDYEYQQLLQEDGTDYDDNGIE